MYKIAIPWGSPPNHITFSHLLPLLSRTDGRLALDLHTMLVKGRQLNYEDSLHPSRLAMNSAVNLLLGELCGPASTSQHEDEMPMEFDLAGAPAG